MTMDALNGSLFEVRKLHQNAPKEKIQFHYRSGLWEDFALVENIVGDDTSGPTFDIHL
jgi:hypothetical protein